MCVCCRGQELPRHWFEEFGFEALNHHVDFPVSPALLRVYATQGSLAVYACRLGLVALLAARRGTSGPWKHMVRPASAARVSQLEWYSFAHRRRGMRVGAFLGEGRDRVQASGLDGRGGARDSAHVPRPSTGRHRLEFVRFIAGRARGPSQAGGRATVGRSVVGRAVGMSVGCWVARSVLVLCLSVPKDRCAPGVRCRYEVSYVLERNALPCRRHEYRESFPWHASRKHSRMPDRLAVGARLVRHDCRSTSCTAGMAKEGERRAEGKGCGW